MKTGLITIVVAALLAGGCATVEPTSTALRARTVPELVSMLNQSRRENGVARRELVRRGAAAVPGMKREMQRLASGRISESKAATLTRLIRVFRDMRSDAAVRTCTDLLVSRSQSVCAPQRTRCALMSEALTYLSGSFDSAAARQAYVCFVTQREDQYLQRKVFKQHWGAQGQADYLRVDIVSAIPKLVEADRTSGRQVLRHLVRNMTRKPFLTTAVCCLDDNGYDLVLTKVSTSMGL